MGLLHASMELLSFSKRQIQTDGFYNQGNQVQPPPKLFILQTAFDACGGLNAISVNCEGWLLGFNVKPQGPDGWWRLYSVDPVGGNPLLKHILDGFDNKAQQELDSCQTFWILLIFSTFYFFAHPSPHREGERQPWITTIFLCLLISSDILINTHTLLWMLYKNIPYIHTYIQDIVVVRSFTEGWNVENYSGFF